MNDKQITVTSPLLPDLDEFNEMLKEIWASKWVTNNGQFHKQLEKALAEYLKVPYISLFTNGTLPLLTALQALRITGEVITTPYSFVATTHSIWWNGCRPVFVDIEEETCGIDPEKIEAAITPKTTAIMPVHCYGKPVNMEAIQQIADKYGLKVIYDAAHAFGVEVPAPLSPLKGAMPAENPPFRGARGACVLHSADPVYYGKLKEYAQENRNHPTEAEALLWNVLSGKGLDGVKFRRQHVIGQYIADFACLDKGLIIELDGHHHSLPPVSEDDAIRTEYLNEEGYSVIRFTNEQVLYHLDDTLGQIRTALQEPPFRGARGASSPPSGGTGGLVSVLSFGDMSTLSFHATKVYNTLEGGALVVKDEQTKKRIDYLKNFGFAGETEVVAPGINSKVDEVRAAYGLLNLKQVDAAIAARQKVAQKYREALRNIPGIRFFDDMPGVRHNYSYFPIFVNAEEYGKTRDELYFKMKEQGIFGRRYFYPLISTFSTYRGLPSATPENLPVATKMANEVICLPMHHTLSDGDIERILDCIVK